MSEFTFIVQVPVNLITTVEANSLEDAVQLVAGQSVKRFCPSCDYPVDNMGQWVVCQSITEDPMEGQLMDCMATSSEPRTGRTEADRKLLSNARALWG